MRAALERPAVAGPVNVADVTSTTAAQLLTTLFEARGMSVRIVAVPTSLAWAAASVAEGVWRLAGRADEPPATRFAVAGLARPFTLDLGRLHRELGVRPDVMWRGPQRSSRSEPTRVVGREPVGRRTARLSTYANKRAEARTPA